MPGSGLTNSSANVDKFQAYFASMAQVYEEAREGLDPETMTIIAILYTEAAEELEEDGNGDLSESAQGLSRRKTTKCAGWWCIVPPMCAAMCVIQALGVEPSVCGWIEGTLPASCKENQSAEFI